MADIILFHFGQSEIRYVGDGINHEWVAQDVFEAIGVPSNDQSNLLEYKQTLTFADCLSFAAEYPNFAFASQLTNFVIDISGSRLWRALYARHYMMFTSNYFLWDAKYSDELMQQSIFSEFYSNGRIPAINELRLIEKEKWPKIKCAPDFLFADEKGLVPGEMKRDIFNSTDLRQLQRYMKSLGVNRGVAVAKSLSNEMILPKNIGFIEFHPIPYEEYCRKEGSA